MQPTGRTRKAVYSTYNYDVWGNEDDGYEVNDVFCINRAVEFTQEELVYNEGLPFEFRCWVVPEQEVKEYFGYMQDVTIDGDDEGTIYLELEDGMPAGEIRFERLAEEI